MTAADAVREFWVRSGSAATVADVSTVMGVGMTTARRQVQAAHDAGDVDRTDVPYVVRSQNYPGMATGTRYRAAWQPTMGWMRDEIARAWEAQGRRIA